MLADGEPTWQVTVIPDATPDLPDTLRRLQILLPLPEERLAEILEEAARSPGFQPLGVAGRLAWDDVVRVAANAPALPGVVLEMSLLRAYPLGPDLAHQAGYGGPVNDADLEADGGASPLLRLPGFQVGKTGVERALDAEIRG